MPLAVALKMPIVFFLTVEECPVEMTRVTVVVVVAEQIPRSQQGLLTSKCSVWMKKYVTLTKISVYEYMKSNLRCLS